MAVRKDEARGKWLAEAYVQKKRVRKWFDTKAEANRFFHTLKNESSEFHQFIQAKKQPKIRLSEMVEQWYLLHGKTLGSNVVYRALVFCVKGLGDPFVNDFKASDFAEYRRARLAGEVVIDGKKIDAVGERRVNFEKLALSAMFNELIRLDKFSGENPLKKLKAIKIKESLRAFLRNNEIKALLSVLDDQPNKELALIARLCLATGARWSEVQNLTGAQVVPYKLIFSKTKSGKNRTVPISPALFAQIPQKQGRIFGDSYSKFCRLLKKAIPSLPNGQASHVLRHTFASHFMMNGGNILVLKDILGHSDIKMTMVYAHLSPSYLESATTLNPLANIEK